jgi:hypothetical protein
MSLISITPKARASKDFKGRRVYKPILEKIIDDRWGPHKSTEVLGRGGAGAMTQGTVYANKADAIAHANNSLKYSYEKHLEQIAKRESAYNFFLEKVGPDHKRTIDAAQTLEEYKADAEAFKIDWKMQYDESKALTFGVDADRAFQDAVDAAE